MPHFKIKYDLKLLQQLIPRNKNLLLSITIIIVDISKSFIDFIKVVQSLKGSNLFRLYLVPSFMDLNRPEPSR